MVWSWAKRKLSKRMFRELETLQGVAQLCVLLPIQDEFARSMTAREATRRAVAIVNDLFGNPVSSVSLTHLDMDECRREANVLMERDLTVRELVVQSLRVRMTVEFGRTQALPADPGQRNARNLEKYGADYPEVPRPEVYRALVVRAVKNLPQHLQELVTSEQFYL